MRRSVPMGDTPRKALSASVGSSSVTQREWCGFVRTHRVPIAPHHANVAHTPTRLPRQPVPPSASTRARWNRLEQPELTSQTAARPARRGAVRGRVTSGSCGRPKIFPAICATCSIAGSIQICDGGSRAFSQRLETITCCCYRARTRPPSPPPAATRRHTDDYIID